MPSVKHYSSSEVNQYELSSRLLSLTENNTSYTLTQINGQRIYRKAPHAWSGPEPSRNCEVFIGRIPHDCFEDTLVPLFRQAGELFEFRLMINFSGWNRGYAFAMYTTEAEAGNAIRLFNNYMIRPSWQLGVCPSINNCRIFISRIPPTTPSAEIVRLLYALTDEVQEVRIRRGAASCAAIVEYKSHRGAAMARKALVAAAAAAWGSDARPAVDWSMPQSPQLLRQYREVGRWSAERGVELSRAEEEPPAAAAPARAASYSLERWSQARRLRMIHEAQRSAARPASAQDWSRQVYGVESLLSSMSSLNLSGQPNTWSPPAAPSPPRVPDFNPWTTRHPLGEFMTPARPHAWTIPPYSHVVQEPTACSSPVLCNSYRHGVRQVGRAQDSRVPLVNVPLLGTDLSQYDQDQAIHHAGLVRVGGLRMSHENLLFCVACLVTKRVSTDDEARLALLLQKLSREWSLLTSVTWDSVGGAFADAVYGGYVIITFALILGRVFHEVPKGRRILEGVLLGFGAIFFIILGGLELASLDSVPNKLVVNASILGTLSLVVAILFLIDLMGPRVYTAARLSQTDAITSPKPEKKVSIITQPAINGQQKSATNGKQNGHIPERPKDLDLEKAQEKETKKDEQSLFDEPKFDFVNLDKLGDIPIEKDLEKSKFGSLRNGIESGNYVRLTEPLSIPDRFHYEQELAKFNEKYLRDYLDNVAGRLPVKEDYLPELQTPVFSKVKSGRLKSLYDDMSPTYEQKNQSKSPTRAKTVPTPTIQQLEDYLRSSNRSRRSETPAIFPMEPIEERDRDIQDNEGRASGTPTDPGFVQYAAKKWPDKTREIRTPRHSPTQ